MCKHFPREIFSISKHSPALIMVFHRMLSLKPNFPVTKLEITWMDDPRRAGMTRAQHIWRGLDAWRKTQAAGQSPGEPGLLPGSDKGKNFPEKMGMSVVQQVHCFICNPWGIRIISWGISSQGLVQELSSAALRSLLLFLTKPQCLIWVGKAPAFA